VKGKGSKSGKIVVSKTAALEKAALETAALEVAYVRVRVRGQTSRRLVRRRRRRSRTGVIRRRRCRLQMSLRSTFPHSLALPLHQRKRLARVHISVSQSIATFLWRQWKRTRTELTLRLHAPSLPCSPASCSPS